MRSLLLSVRAGMSSWYQWQYNTRYQNDLVNHRLVIHCDYQLYSRNITWRRWMMMVLVPLQTVNQTVHSQLTCRQQHPLQSADFLQWPWHHGRSCSWDACSHSIGQQPPDSKSLVHPTSVAPQNKAPDRTMWCYRKSWSSAQHASSSPSQVKNTHTHKYVYILWSRTTRQH